MGLSINYSGKFKVKASLQEMIEEVEDIANIYKWEYHVYERAFPKQIDKTIYDNKIYGISFSPPECESVSLEFLSNRRMSSSVHLKYFGNSDNKDYQLYLYHLSVKTQFAGITIHMIIIQLLKYLSKKYFTNFKVFDEGKYWETSDENVLKERFAQYNKLLNTVCESIQNFPTKPGESIESYFDRLVQYINEKRKMDH